MVSNIYHRVHPPAHICTLANSASRPIPYKVILGFQHPGGCFTNVSRALQKIISKFVYCTNSTCDENFKLKLCTCAQSLALGTRTNFQIEILTINVISGVVYFRENILGSSRNVSETAPWLWYLKDRVDTHQTSGHTPNLLSFHYIFYSVSNSSVSAVSSINKLYMNRIKLCCAWQEMRNIAIMQYSSRYVLATIFCTSDQKSSAAAWEG